MRKDRDEIYTYIQIQSIFLIHLMQNEKMYYLSFMCNGSDSIHAECVIITLFCRFIYKYTGSTGIPGFGLTGKFTDNSKKYKEEGKINQDHKCVSNT